ncbi:MAG TPA: Fe-S-containing protein [Bacteroidota bacterium]|nr:Fe-S-containing protein [Bacteroidota bacterium]
MIETTIIALREGIEMALVIGILIVYLRKISAVNLIRTVYLALAAAIAASIGGAVVMERLGFDSEALEGYFLLFASIFVLSMIVWMWTTSRKIKNEIEEKVDSIIGGKTTWRAHFGIFIFAFFMIVREGMETAVFIQAVSTTTDGWKSILGTSVGLALAAIFGVLFIRGSVKIDIGRFLKITACTLAIFTLQLLTNALHEFYENGVLPASPKMMGILGPIVQNGALFIGAILTIPGFMLVFPGWNPNREKSQRRWQLIGGIATICIVLFLGVGDVFSANTAEDLSAAPITVPVSGVISIPVSSVNDGYLHRYSIQDSGLTIRFFAIRTKTGKFATCFDACRACYGYGKYYMKKGELICSQCDAPAPLSKLKPSIDLTDTLDSENPMQGNGCVPVYLPSHIENGNIQIAVKDIQAQRKYFDIIEN